MQGQAAMEQTGLATSANAEHGSTGGDGSGYAMTGT